MVRLCNFNILKRDSIWKYHYEEMEEIFDEYFIELFLYASTLPIRENIPYIHSLGTIETVKYFESLLWWVPETFVPEENPYMTEETIRRWNLIHHP